MEEQIQFIREQLEMLTKNGTIESAVTVIKANDNVYVSIVGTRMNTLAAMTSALTSDEELKGLIGASVAFNELLNAMKKKEDGGGQ